MTRILLNSITVLAACVALSACDAHRLSDLNSEFVSVYNEKIGQRADMLDGLPLPASESVQGQFTQIATAATEAADDLNIAEEPRLRIGFRRLAVMASWQAAAPKDDPTLSLQTKGKQDCDASNNFQRSPRDCLMIEYVGTLAVNDATARRLQKSGQRPAGAAKFPAARLAEFKDMFDKFKGYLRDMNATTEQKKPLITTVPGTFWSAVARQSLIIYCNARTAATYYDQTKGAPTDNNAADYWVKLINSLKETTDKLSVHFPGTQYNFTACTGLMGGLSAAKPPV